MAWAESLPDGGYRACWRDGSGRPRSTVMDRKTRQRFRTALKARTYAVGMEAIARDNGPQNDGTGLTWGQWCERWLELRRVEASTRRGDQGRVDNYLRPHWERKKLRTITHHQVQAWVNQLADSELSPSTVRLIFYCFSASMKAAVKDGKIAATPCALVTLPKPAPAKEHYLSKAEFWTLHAYLDQPWADAAVILAYTGLRFGELAGLHWDRVSLEAGVLRVAETWDDSAGRVKPYPKSGKQRAVPLPPEAVEVITGRPSYATSCGLPHAKGSTCGSDLVIRAPHGGPLDSSTMGHAIDTATGMLGLGHTRNHDLRHTYASWLGQDGVALHVIQQLLGHGSITTTQRYSHFGSEQYARVLAALS